MGCSPECIHFPYLLRLGCEHLGSATTAHARHGVIRSRTTKYIAHNFSHTTCKAINLNFWSHTRAAASPFLFADLPLDSIQCICFCHYKGFVYNPARSTSFLGYRWLISASLNIGGQLPRHIVRYKAHIILI